MPAAYDRYLVRTIFAPFAADLARRAVALRPGRVLELAAGTGALTVELVASLPGAAVTATDLNAAMVEYGAGKVPSAAWRTADATELPFADAGFDLVVCQFGVMFFPDKGAAFAEAARVLGGEGRFLFNTWATVEEHDFAAALSAALERVLPADVPAFVVAVPHGYSDPDTVVADLAAGGMECVAHERIVAIGQAGSAAELAVGFCTGTPLRAALEARGDLDAITAEVAREMEARLGPGPVTGRMAAHVFEARPRT